MNELMNELITKVGIELLGQLKKGLKKIYSVTEIKVTESDWKNGKNFKHSVAESDRKKAFIIGLSNRKSL